MSKNKVLDINKEDLTTLVNEVGNQIAEAEGKTMEEMYNGIKDQMNSKNEAVRNKGLRAAAQFVAQLTQLVLKQSIEHIGVDLERFNLLRFFRQETMDEGNSKQYILPLNTGTESYSDTPFVPNAHTDPQIEVKQINFFQANGNLTDNAYQYHKPLSIRAHEWTPYFKSNTLSDFVATIKAHMGESIQLLKLASAQKFIKDLAPNKEIDDQTSQDAYEAFIELFKHIQNCYDFNIEYNLNGTSKNVKPSTKENLVLFMNKNTINILMNGIKSRLPKGEIFQLSRYINEDNIVPLGNILKHNTTSSEVIVVDAGEIIPETEIKVVDKRALLQFSKLSFSGEQLYNQNMTLQLDIHYWYKLDNLEWYKAFKYKCNNLTVIPT